MRNNKAGAARVFSVQSAVFKPDTLFTAAEREAAKLKGLAAIAQSQGASTTTAKLSERRDNVLCLDDGTRWRVEAELVPVLEGWRMFDVVEITGSRPMALLTNTRKQKRVRASRMKPGEEG